MSKAYAYSGNVYDNSAAGTTTFALTSTDGNAIRYLQRSHIHVYKSAGDQQPWIELSRPADWDFNAEGTEVILSAGITTGEWIRLLRITPYVDRYVDFQEGSLLTANQLDEGEDFSIFVDQELSDEIGNLVENAGVPEAPNDGNQYGRQSEAWTEIPDAGIPDAPNNGKQYGRESETWTEIPAGVSPAPSDGKTYGQKNGNWSEAANEAALDGRTYGRKDGGWVDVGTIGDYVTEAPDDGVQYGRQSEGWTPVAATLPDAPQDGNPYGRQDASWVRIDDGTGGLVYRGTINVVADPPPAAVAGDLYINTGVGNAGGLWTGIAGDAVIGDERISFTANSEWVSFGAGQVDQDLQSVLEEGNTATAIALDLIADVNGTNQPVLNTYYQWPLGTNIAGLVITGDGSITTPKNVEASAFVGDAYTITDTGNAQRKWTAGSNATWAAKVTDSAFSGDDLIRSGFKWNGDVKCQSILIEEHVTAEESVTIGGTLTLNTGDVNMLGGDIALQNSGTLICTHSGLSNDYGQMNATNLRYSTQGAGVDGTINLLVDGNPSDPSISMGTSGKLFAKHYDLEHLPALP